MMESWRIVWRNGFVPSFSVAMLEALRDGVANDDPKLTQGSTTTPPPLMCVADWPTEAACAICYMVVRTKGGFFEGFFPGTQTPKNPGACKIRDSEEGFAQLCFEADQRLGEPAACRWFLNWFDDTPRDEMRRELLPEVELAIARKRAA